MQVGLHGETPVHVVIGRKSRGAAGRRHRGGGQMTRRRVIGGHGGHGRGGHGRSGHGGRGGVGTLGEHVVGRDGGDGLLLVMRMMMSVVVRSDEGSGRSGRGQVGVMKRTGRRLIQSITTTTVTITTTRGRPHQVIVIVAV